MGLSSKQARWPTGLSGRNSESSGSSKRGSFQLKAELLGESETLTIGNFKYYAFNVGKIIRIRAKML